MIDPRYRKAEVSAVLSEQQHAERTSKSRRLRREPQKTSSNDTKESTDDCKAEVEIFSAGCPTCTEAVALVQKLACPSCEVEILDMHDTAVAKRALGVPSVPAIAINGELADCCAGRGVNEQSLRAAGLGTP